MMDIRHPNIGRLTCRTRRQHGFTLLEAALTIIIVGTGFVSTMQLYAVCTQNNRDAASMTTSMFLANNIQETLADMPFSDPSGAAFGLEETGQAITAYDDIDDFHGWVSWPNAPVDASRDAITSMAQYEQRVTVTLVDTNKPSLAAAGTDAAKVTVSVYYHRTPPSAAQLVHQISWIRVRG
jgi:Tfp pilus assembly protein PilV